mmetsp:Transcript_1844/g.6533  ORF Transcript_1844/g.6533 Transcript_1844/m.6533 type:complete len:330 (+) Transcript_1844:5315-6304(+)
MPANQKKSLLSGFQFRSFKRSSTFNPETGEETKIEQVAEQEEAKKDLIDEILEKEREEEERRRLEEEKENGGGPVQDEDNQENINALGAEQQHEEADGQNKDGANAHNVDEEGGVANANTNNESNQIQTDTAATTEEQSTTDADQKSIQITRKTIEELEESDDDDEHNEQGDGSPINDQYDDLPLYQRLQKQAEENLAEHELMAKTDTSVLEARMYIPQGLSKDDVQYFESLRQARDTRQQDEELNQRLKEKARQNLLSLEEKKRKRDQMEELFTQGKKKRKTIDEQEVDLDTMIELVGEGEVSAQSQEVKDGDGSNEITSLFSGYTSE